MKLFIFWIGEKNDLVEKNIDILKKQKIDYEIGPSAEDHDFLMKDSPFYKKAFEGKFFSFCSDVWRLYKLKTSEGVYLDVSAEFGPEIGTLIEECKRSETTLLKLDDSNINATLMATTVKKNKIFTQIYDEYSADWEFPLKTRFIMQNWLTNKTKSMGIKPQWDPYFSKEIQILTVDKIRREGIYKKLGFNSWVIRKANNYDNWVGLEKNFIERKKDIERMKFEEIFFEFPDSPNIKYIRELYDISKNRSERRELTKAYKAIPYKVKFGEKLIWSKLFIFFTFKWLKKENN